VTSRPESFQEKLGNQGFVVDLTWAGSAFAFHSDILVLRMAETQEGTRMKYLAVVLVVSCSSFACFAQDSKFAVRNASAPAGIVDEHIEAAEFASHLFEHRAYLRFNRNIGGNRKGGASGRANLCGQLIRGFARTPKIHGHKRAFSSETLGDRAPNSRGSAGDESCPTL
jgi:hypothetical protein